jgi:tRNA A22 N-methylase
MDNLSVLQESKEALEREETLLLCATSLQESVRQWLRLQSAFEWQLQQTATLFEQDRRNAMIELQARLRRLID